MAESVYDIFKFKAQKARDDADRRSAEVWAKDDRIQAIDKELSETGLKIFAAALSGDGNREEAYKRLEARINSLKEEKKERLANLGLPTDYTDVKYECPKCSDTGYVGIKMCSCLKKELTSRSYRNSGIGKYLEKQTFDNFDLSYYPFGQSREQMSIILNKTKSFADSFNDDTTSSLIFMGGTGLGKTHLSSAIAKTVIEKGYSVMYDSAQNIISSFEKDRFLKENEAHSSERYLDADLLIIDDLGAEIQSRSSVSYFYTVINTRLISSKPTIISTNLNPTELTAQYDKRIVSRLLCEYTVLPFYGDDIRKVKNR